MEMNHPLHGCRWVGSHRDCQSPVILRRFMAEKPVAATLTVTGLGYFEAKINGIPVTGDRLQPVCSEYGPRELTAFSYPLRDELTYRIYYRTFDVSGLLRQGENLLSIQLGNGWYRQTERRNEGPQAYGDTLKTIYCLDLDGARICSDGSETWRESHIVYNNLFIGEVHDFQRTPGPEQPVQLLEEEPAVLSEQIGIPDRVIRRLTPKLLWEKDGVRIYDARENISGIVRLMSRGREGEKITLRFAENLTPEGSLDFASAGERCILKSGRNQIQTDVCICGKEPAVFEPRFCWHAFRYFELTGPGEEPEVLVIHSDAPVTASFDSDSEGLNFLFDAFIRTQLNNMHGSIPSDCPHRERLGYTGDGQVASAAAMMTLDCRDFYRKWMQDILDTQDRISGHVQHTAPLGGGGGGPVGWGGAIVVVPYRYFKQYGDTELLEHSWEPIRKWIGYIQSRMDGFLITREEPGGWCLGDWAALDPIAIPEPFVNTCLFVRYLDMLVEAAPAVGREADVSGFKKLQEQCREGLRSTYFDESTGHFCGGVQGADAYGIYAGLGDERTAKLLKEHYTALGYFDTGFIGTDVLLEVLLGMGETDLACDLLTTEQCGSFLHMKRHVATTIWEHWDGRESHNHPMFGGCARHLFEGFLGIRQKYGTGGYSDVTVEPRLPGKIQKMSGSLHTPRGKLSVSLTREEGNVTIVKEVP